MGESTFAPSSERWLRARRTERQHDRLGGAHHPPTLGPRRVVPEREVAAAEPRSGVTGAAGAAAAGGSGRQQTHSGQQAQAGQVRTGEAAQGVPAPSKGGQQTQQPAKEAAAQQNASQGGKPQEGRGAAAKAGLAAAAGVATGRAAADGSKDDADKARQVGRTRRTRKARLRLSQIDPWSVMKTSFLFSIAGAVILIVATLVVYGVLEASGLFNHINTIVAPFLETPGDTEKFDIKRYIGFQRVLGGSVVLAAINIAIITALATLGAFLYNLASSLIGGLEVTLAED